MGHLCLNRLSLPDEDVRADKFRSLKCLILTKNTGPQTTEITQTTYTILLKQPHNHSTRLVIDLPDLSITLT